MQYKITKVYLLEAADRHDAHRRFLAEGETHLRIISIQELKPRTASRPDDELVWASPAGLGHGSGSVG
ncbi:MAG TPA: hypothetical protein VK066_29480 [Chloroflexota bacterium]|nr:hypothetical protein [Chloroflexota bacterium]